MKDAPKSNEETEITGPTFLWSGGTTPVELNPADINKEVAGLRTNLPPNYGGTYPAYEGIVGWHTVPVGCTATFIARNRQTNEETPIVASGYKYVSYFIKTPMEVVSNGPKISTTYQGDPAPGLEGLWWGQGDVYPLKVVDNQSPPQLYNYGQPKEVFVTKNDPLNLVTPYTWDITATFEDTIFSGAQGDNAQYVDANVADDEFVFSFTQEWHLLERILGTPSGFADKTLNTDFVEKRWRYSTRQ